MCRLTGLHAVCSLHICRVTYGYMLCVHFGNGYMQCALGYMFCIGYTLQWHALCPFWHDYARSVYLLAGVHADVQGIGW